MDSEYELINVTLFEPHNSFFKSSANEKAECTRFYCKSKDSCDLYKTGRCINVANFLSCSCLYGKKSREDGFTKRARKYHSWIAERKEKYSDYLYKLNSKANKLAEIGEYVFLPYAHMSMAKHIPFESHSGFMSSGSPFIRKELFTPELIVKLCEFKPMAMMGGEIKAYQKEQVPKFLKDLEDLKPALYKEVIALNPDLTVITESYSYVGRKALIHSLKPGTVIKKKCNYLWDGEYLTSTDYDILFAIVKFDEIELKLKPKEGETVEITSDDQVDSDTKFAD